MKRVDLIENEDERYASIWCPGCNSPHTLRLREPKGKRPSWTFNGDAEKPTFKPSVLVNRKGPHHAKSFATCHSFITDGQIRFLSDSTHDLAGQTVDLPEYPEEWRHG